MRMAKEKLTMLLFNQIWNFERILGDVIEEANVEANLTETLPYGVTVSKEVEKNRKMMYIFFRILTDIL